MHPAHLLFVVVLDGVLVTLLQPGERHAHLRGPPDLRAGERHLRRRAAARSEPGAPGGTGTLPPSAPSPRPRHLGRVVEDPLLPGLLLVSHHGLWDLVAERGAHAVQHAVQPHFHLREEGAC